MKKSYALAFMFFFMVFTIITYAMDKQEIIQTTKTLYLELLSFKDKAHFHKFGFGAGGPYHKWLKKIEELENDPNARLLIAEGIVVGDLKMLGLEYMKSKGKETEYTQFMEPEIKKALKIE